MRSFHFGGKHIFSILAMFLLSGAAASQQVTDTASSQPSVVQGTLIAPGSSPFHLKATVTEGRDSTPVAHVEIFWAAPDKWRRTIQSEDFSQTLVVNGDKVFEEDSKPYFPLGLQTLVTAMVDPRPILEAVRPGDRVMTKANGLANESGVRVYGNIAMRSPNGLSELIGAPGHSVDFRDYQEFEGKRVARVLVNGVGVGEFLTAQVTELKKLKNHDESLFQVTRPTPMEEQIRSVRLPENEFRSLVSESHEIVWPQVLDGATTGTATFYVSVDRSGQLREVLPLHTANERSNDSARRQLMKWKFKPAMRDGVPVQAESILTFSLNTRAWGPSAPLSDAEVRKLVSNAAEPVFSHVKAHSGDTCRVMVAIDSEGYLIEAIPGDGTPGLFQACYQAVSKWHFSPLLQDGKPRPYRAEIKFQAP